MAYESKARVGSRFYLLIHVGTDERRTDKFYLKLANLLDELTPKGYSFLRIDELLD